MSKRQVKVDELTRDQLNQLKVVFEVLDSNKDGLLNKADTLEAARMLGSPLAPFNALPDDGMQEFDVFAQLMLRGLCLDPLLQPFEMAVSQFYHTLDQDGKGYVTLKELQHYFEQTGLKAQPDIVRALMDQLDTTLMGERFTLEELTEFMRIRAEKEEFVYE